eukprot:1523486-Prorocentrum_lima.AAC.1
MVKDAMDPVVSKDDVLKKTMMDELAEPWLRNTRRLGDVASFIITMLEEVRVRSNQGRTARH